MNAKTRRPRVMRRDERDEDKDRDDAMLVQRKGRERGDEGTRSARPRLYPALIRALFVDDVCSARLCLARSAAAAGSIHLLHCLLPVLARSY